MSYKPDKSLDLIDELAQTLNIVGTNKTVMALQEARGNFGDHLSKHKIEQFILQVSCKSFRISQQSIFSKKNHGTRGDCLMVMYVLHKKHLTYSLAQIGKRFKKHPSIISKKITEFNSLKDDSRRGQHILSKYAQINRLAEEFKLSMKA